MNHRFNVVVNVALCLLSLSGCEKGNNTPPEPITQPPSQIAEQSDASSTPSDEIMMKEQARLEMQVAADEYNGYIKRGDFLKRNVRLEKVALDKDFNLTINYRLHGNDDIEDRVISGAKGDLEIKACYRFIKMMRHGHVVRENFLSQDGRVLQSKVLDEESCSEI